MSESVIYLLKFCAVFFAIFLIIGVVTVLTPKMASLVDRLIDKFIKNNPARVDDEIYKVRSIYDAPPSDKNAEASAENSNSNDNGEVKNG